MKIKRNILSILFVILFTFSLSSCFITKALGEFYYSDFRAKEKTKMNSYFGFVIPFCKGYDYKFYDSYEEDHSILYFIDNIHKNYYEEYLSNYSNYEFRGERIKDNVTFKTFYNKEYYTYIDTCYEENTLGSNGLWVYMYHRGYVNYYSQYYTNANHPIEDISDNIKMSDCTYSKISDINGYSKFCPTTGDIKILVVPVDFKDSPASRINFSIETIRKALNENTTPYPSLKDYYYQSSYQKLNLSFEIVNEWYRASKNSSHYNSSDAISALVDEILAHYDNIYDYSSFDSNKDGAIDGIILVDSLASSNSLDISWPTTRNDINQDSNGLPYTFDNTHAYRFIHINYDQIMVKKEINTYTLIHEFGHLIGLDDYYDTSYTNRTFLNPLGDKDVMDYKFTDQNAFSKLYLGWINDAKVINKSKDITLSSFEETGDLLIISNNFDMNYGPFQEFYIIVYNSGTKLNKYSDCLNKKGIIIYHVDGSLYTYSDGTTYLNYNNDQSGIHSERFNLIEFAKKDYEPYVIDFNNSTKANLNLIDNNGLKLNFSIEIKAMESDNINLHIEKE